METGVGDYDDDDHARICYGIIHEARININRGVAKEEEEKAFWIKGEINIQEEEVLEAEVN